MYPGVLHLPDDVPSDVVLPLRLRHIDIVLTKKLGSGLGLIPPVGVVAVGVLLGVQLLQSARQASVYICHEFHRLPVERWLGTPLSLKLPHGKRERLLVPLSCFGIGCEPGETQTLVKPAS